MIFTQLEKVSEQKIRDVINEYCRENEIKDAGSTEIAGRSLETVVCDIVGRVISECAKEDRRSFKQAQRRGIDEAKARGTVLGRPKKQFPPGFEKLYKAYCAGSITARECADVLEVTPSTFSYMIKKYNRESGE